MSEVVISFEVGHAWRVKQAIDKHAERSCPARIARQLGLTTPCVAASTPRSSSTGPTWPARSASPAPASSSS